MPRTSYEEIGGENISRARLGLPAESRRQTTNMSPPNRVIFINQNQPQKYCSNKICTAKYTFLSFLPKFLFEQFRRYANIFFLFVALIQQIPDVSPTGRYTTAVPLILIFCISALKEIIEDIKRYRADDETNNRTTKVLRDEQWQILHWKEVSVGDIIRVANGETFPADLIMLGSSEPKGMCYIETASLDGETNLKIRQALELSNDFQTPSDLARMQGTVECERPNPKLYRFFGNLRIADNAVVPIGAEQLLLRGAALKNTQWINGIVAYTGLDSKLMLNSVSAPLKRSSVENVVNKQILMLFLILVVISVISTIAYYIITVQELRKGHWYLGFQEKDPTNFGFTLLTFFILYNNLIPISLQVTLEMVKFLQALYINWDLDMYCEKTNTPAMARTSNLNEELGQVKYLFSDKTGTLTQNVMVLKKSSIGGKVYGNSVKKTRDIRESFFDVQLTEVLKAKDATVDDFVTLMAVCHTVVPDRTDDDGEIDESQYLASSPDERALVLAAKDLDYTFSHRSPDSVTIEVFTEKRVYQILNVLEFTSDRKRMGVIVKDEQGRIRLFVKGADNVIFDRLSPNSDYQEETKRHLHEFASNGLRTLCLAVADIPQKEYDMWAPTFYKAATSLKDREKKVEMAAELIEKDLTLLGCTAIEDKLQDGVPDAIAALSAASIKVWVLTGDKKETAVNIGYACRHLTMDMQVLYLTECDLDDTRDLLVQFTEVIKTEPKEKDLSVALVIDGATLEHALSPDCVKDFLNISVRCKAVICVRVSPIQKASVVDLIRKEIKAITLAIGDGANDVGMIQAAHVGVGISGVEGLQAANASDYSIAQFRFLKKLLLVHGAWSYTRLTKLILYSFYKNICLYLISFWFASVSGFSGQVLFERWSLALYNVFFSAAPPLAIGFFDKHCSEKSLMAHPSLYKITQNSTLFNVKIFWIWCINAVFHSILLFVLPWLALRNDVAFSDGKVGDYLFLGNIIYTYVIVTVCLKAGIETTSWTWLTHLAVWASITNWLTFLAIYPMVWPKIDLGPEMVGMNKYIFTCPIFWLGFFVIPVACLLRDVVVKAFFRTVQKSLSEQVQEMELRHEDPTEFMLQTTRKKLTETARLLRNVFTRSSTSIRGRGGGSSSSADQHTGYAFSQEEGGIVTQTQLIRHYSHPK